ncbi:MAG: molybdate ABC transporter substrate-binding protein [Burkholderiales bacterium]
MRLRSANRSNLVAWLAAAAAVLLGACTTPSPPGPSAPLPWPTELPSALLPKSSIYVSEKSNVVLDLHGSVQDPDLVLFMAGNQYRALPDLITAFRDWVAKQDRFKGVKVDRIFYATTPPGRLIDAMDSGQLALGNYWIDVRPDKLWPDVFMTGARQQRRLAASKYIDGWSVYTRNRGVVLLVRAGNPKNIRSVADLLRDDVRVAISSPQREPASFESYSNTLRAQGGSGIPDMILKKSNTISPVAVHHRENPQLIYDNEADVAPMYFHFGDYLKTHIPKHFDYVILPAQGNNRDELAVSLIRNAPRKAAATAWIEFIRSDAAALIYQRHGFELVAPAERNRMLVP